MKAIFFFLVSLGSLAAQLTVPEKGWRRLQEKEEVGEVKRIGVWQNVDQKEGAVMVAAAWVDEMPALPDLLDFPAVGVADSGSVRKVELVEKPSMGLMVEFQGKKYLHHEGVRHYWFAGKKGGVFLQVYYDEGADLSFDGWKIEGVLEDKNGAEKKKLEEVLAKIEAAKVEPLVRINPKLTPPVVDGIAKVDGENFTVVVRKNGAFEFDGNEVDREDLGKEMRKAVRETKKEIVLKIEAEKEVEFKYMLRVIKAAAAAGIKRVAYASFAADKEDEEE